MEKTIALQIEPHDYKGLAIGLIISAAWSAQTFFLLNSEFSGIYLCLIPLMIILQTFLYTGLFITTHDAMHGLVLPKHPTLNNYIGCLAVLLYALFSYTKLRKKHQEHHKFPASNKDPDFYDGKHKNFPVWYVNFLSNYLSLSQILGMAIIFNIRKHLLGISTSNLLLFWVVPAISSTLQLSQAHSSYFISEPICSIVNWHRDTLIAIVLEAIAILSSSHSSLVIISVTIGNTMLILKSHGGSYLTLGNRKNFKPIYLTQKNAYHVYLFKKNHLIGISSAIPFITSDRR